MWKMFSLLLVATFVMAPALADENMRKCLADRVLISNAKIDDVALSDELRFDLLNNLAWPIVGIRFRYSIKSGSDQWKPWLEKDDAIEIIGGVKPNVTVSIAVAIQSIPKDLKPPITVEIKLLDVADSQKRQVLNDVQMPLWAKVPSTEVCK
jgi:hypothetical protein